MHHSSFSSFWTCFWQSVLHHRENYTTTFKLLQAQGRVLTLTCTHWIKYDQSGLPVSLLMFPQAGGPQGEPLKHEPSIIPLPVGNHDMNLCPPLATNSLHSLPYEPFALDALDATACNSAVSDPSSATVDTLSPPQPLSSFDSLPIDEWRLVGDSSAVIENWALFGQ